MFNILLFSLEFFSNYSKLVSDGYFFYLLFLFYIPAILLRWYVPAILLSCFPVSYCYFYIRGTFSYWSLISSPGPGYLGVKNKKDKENLEFFPLLICSSSVDK